MDLDAHVVSSDARTRLDGVMPLLGRKLHSPWLSCVSQGASMEQVVNSIVDACEALEMQESAKRKQRRKRVGFLALAVLVGWIVFRMKRNKGKVLPGIGSLAFIGSEIISRINSAISTRFFDAIIVLLLSKLAPLLIPESKSHYWEWLL